MYNKYSLNYSFIFFSLIHIRKYHQQKSYGDLVPLDQ